MEANYEARSCDECKNSEPHVFLHRVTPHTDNPKWWCLNCIFETSFKVDEMTIYDSDGYNPQIVETHF